MALKNDWTCAYSVAAEEPESGLAMLSCLTSRSTCEARTVEIQNAKSDERQEEFFKPGMAPKVFAAESK
jgi:hypothetical protein